MKPTKNLRTILPYVFLATILMVTFSLAFDAWAAPANSPLRQSVPTKTPLPGEEGAEKSVTLPAQPTATPIPTFTPEPEPSSGIAGSPFAVVGIVVIAVVLIGAVAVVLLRRPRR